MRVLSLLLVLLLIMNTAVASVAVRFDQESALLTESGNPMIEPGVYTDIVALGSDYFACSLSDGYALMNAGGEILSDFIYTSLTVCGDLVIGGIGNRFQLLDNGGVPLTGAIYAKIVPGIDGKAWALRGDGDQLWVLSKSGASYAPCGEIDTIANRSGDGLLAVRLRESMLWGYCDASGKQVIADKYTFADDFSGGLARAVLDGYYGVIDTSGNTVVPFIYDVLEISESYILAQNSEAVTVMDRSGETRMVCEPSILGFALPGPSYALYTAEEIKLYGDKGETEGVFPIGTQLFSGLDGELIISTGQWGERCVYLLSAPDELWQDLFPLGYADGEPVYRGSVMDVNIVHDALLDEAVYQVDKASVRYQIVSAQGKACSERSYCTLQHLGENRFLAETETQWQMIDAVGNIYYTYEKKVS